MSTQPGEQTDFGANEWLVYELQQQYLKDPDSVSELWQDYFSDGAGSHAGRAAGNGTPPPAVSQAAATHEPSTASPTQTDAKAPVKAAPAPSKPEPKPAPAVKAESKAAAAPNSATGDAPDDEDADAPAEPTTASLKARPPGWSATWRTR